MGWRKVTAATTDWEHFGSLLRTATEALVAAQQGERRITFRRAFALFLDMRRTAREIYREYRTATPEKHEAYRIFLASVKSRGLEFPPIPWNHIVGNAFIYGPAVSTTIWVLSWGIRAMLIAVKHNAAIDERKARKAWEGVVERSPGFAASVRERTLKTFDRNKAVEADWEDTH